jgi:hypothetical protein
MSKTFAFFIAFLLSCAFDIFFWSLVFVQPTSHEAHLTILKQTPPRIFWASPPARLLTLTPPDAAMTESAEAAKLGGDEARLATKIVAGASQERVWPMNSRRLLMTTGFDNAESKIVNSDNFDEYLLQQSETCLVCDIILS